MSDTQVYISGRPHGKCRPRFSHGRTYTPKATVEYENAIKWAYTQQGGALYDTPVQVEVTAIYKIPASWSKRKKEYVMINRIPPVIRPDIDNVIKTVLDALNGVAYADDSSVAKVEGTKVYDMHREGVLIRIGEYNAKEIAETKSTSC